MASRISNSDYKAPLTAENFLNDIIVPAYWGLASSNVRFGVSDLDERLIICSENYAKEVGFKDFKEAMNKRPGIDYPRYGGTPEDFAIQRQFLKTQKRSFNYVCKYQNNGAFYMSTAEPVINTNGEVIGKKEVDVELKLFSHRDIVESYFKRYGSNIAAMEDITKTINLTEREEMVLFMLLAGFTQKEIGEFLSVSRTYILKIIAEGLCVKLGLKVVSTKSLVERAVALGYTRLVPAKFLEVFNTLAA